MISASQIDHLIRAEKSSTTLLKVLVSDDGKAWSVIGSFGSGARTNRVRLAQKLANARFVKVARVPVCADAPKPVG